MTITANRVCPHCNDYYMEVACYICDECYSEAHMVCPNPQCGKQMYYFELNDECIEIACAQKV